MKQVMGIRVFSIIIVVFLAVILTTSLATTRGNLTLGKQHIIGLEIGAKFDQTEYALRYGEPVVIGNIGNRKKYTFIHSLGLVVSEIGTLSSISIQGEDSEFTTEKGIRPGDSVEKVIENYGAPRKQYSDQGAQVKVYRDRKNKLSLEFWTVENKVHTIRLKDTSE
ncbi:hypothetical protein D7M11_05745 [Paenibacillus ginsengarvi]|uniref:DUF4309 domain-containing protein n=2 Tax=Paenibacillus ginsengarvi TaxID=400777 RepID=A0A3B0CN77_9BACL|nr:hypothetical protein D7M11_05745 [Paenibacillus ginsengarvi]